ncbi:MAG: hypothetical protein ACR2HP_11330 [Ilumatobacteraceae bacterium]
MSERENNLALFRVADENAVDDPAAQERLAAILPAYAAGAAGWFARFQEIDSTFGAGLPESLEELLVTMGTEDLRPSVGAQRLLAIAAVVRAVPPSDAQIDELALLLGPLVPDGGDAGELLRLLGGAGLRDTSNDSEWQAIIDQAREDGLVHFQIALAAYDCCQDDVLSVPVGGHQESASVLQTYFATTEVTLEQLQRYFDPANWPTCATLWCSMEPLTPVEVSPTCYREVISLDCDNPNAWRLTTPLRFVRTNLPGGGISLEYQLCTDATHPHHADGYVTVDEGTITAYQDTDGLRVVTTKRVRFDREYDAASFAMWSCALGYGEAARTMAVDCALGNSSPEHPWDPHVPSGGPLFDQLEHFIDHFAHTSADGLKACASKYRSAVDKVAAGTYTMDHFVGDVTDSWARAAKDALHLLAPFAAPTQAPSNTPSAARPTRTLRSNPCHAGVSSVARDIALAGPLVSGFNDRIPVSALEVEPPSPLSTAGDFVIKATIGEQRAGTYVGAAAATTPPGSSGNATTSVSIPVWLQVS